MLSPILERQLEEKKSDRVSRRVNAKRVYKRHEHAQSVRETKTKRDTDIEYRVLEER